MATKKRFDILSPDGFGLFRDEDFATPEEAETAFIGWAKRFEAQGYYSSNNGRISLSELRSHCRLIDYEPETDEDDEE